MQQLDAVRRALQGITGSFALAAVAIVVVLAFITPEDPTSPDLADGALLAVGVLGAIGVLAAMRWFTSAGERPRSPARVQIGFIARVAVAELGLLVGVVARFLTGSLAPALLGLGLFLLSLLLLTLGLRQLHDSS